MLLKYLGTIRCIVALLAGVTICCVAKGADDSRKFVDALRERHYLDTATEYLEQHKANAKTPDAAKREVPYLQALVIIDAAALEGDPQRRDYQLNEAQSKLQEFLAANPAEELAPLARDRLANLLRFRASNSASRAENTEVNGPRLKSEAVALHKEARELFKDSAARLRAQIDQLPKGDASKEQREQLGGQWLGATLNVGRCTFDIALLAEPNSEEQKRLLNDATVQFAKLYENFPQRLAGITARFYEGRCHLELGDQKRALSAFNNVLSDLPDGEEAFRALKTQTLRYALGVWIEQKDYKKAVEKSLAWAKTARGAELVDADWLAVKLSTAIALKDLAATESDAEKSGEYQREARELALEVLKSKTAEFQRPAGDLLAEIGRQMSQPAGPFTAKSTATKNQVKFAADTRTAPAAKVPDPALDAKTFEEACDAATEAADEIKSAQVELNFAQQENTPDSKQITELKATIAANREKSLAYCQRAIHLADEKTDPTKLNLIRYLTCYFQYAKGNYDEAAVIGNFIVNKQPKSLNARDAARVTLAALGSLQRNASRRAKMQASRPRVYWT